MWLRITSDPQRELGPTAGRQSWAVWEERRVAVAASVRSASADPEGTAGTIRPVDHLAGASPFVGEMLALARSSPIGAVAGSERRVGQELVRMLVADGAGDVKGLNVTELAFLAGERSLINRSTRDGIEGIAVMHTMAVLDDGGRRLQEHQAQEYVGLAEGLLLALRLPPNRVPDTDVLIDASESNDPARTDEADQI
jgi:hypothetical protein